MTDPKQPVGSTKQPGLSPSEGSPTHQWEHGSSTETDWRRAAADHIISCYDLDCARSEPSQEWLEGLKDGIEEIIGWYHEEMHAQGSPASAGTATHFQSGCCIGEQCTACGKSAAHKVGEEQFPDDLRKWAHNLTAYVCCEHFRMIMGRCEPMLMPDWAGAAPSQESPAKGEEKMTKVAIVEPTYDFAGYVIEPSSQRRAAASLTEICVREGLDCGPQDWEAMILQLARK